MRSRINRIICVAMVLMLGGALGLTEADAQNRKRNDAANRRAQQDAARRAQQNAARRQAQQNAARRAQQDAARRAAQRRAQQDAARRANQDAARRRAQQDAARRAQQDAARRAAQRRTQQDAARRAQQDAARRKASEASRRRAAEDANRRRASEASRRRAADEANRRRAAEASRRRASDEANRRRASDAARRRAAEEANRRRTGDAARRLAAEEVNRRRSSDAARRRAADEANRRSATDAARRRAADAARRRANTKPGNAGRDRRPYEPPARSGFKGGFKRPEKKTPTPRRVDGRSSYGSAKKPRGKVFVEPAKGPSKRAESSTTAPYNRYSLGNRRGPSKRDAKKARPVPRKRTGQRGLARARVPAPEPTLRQKPLRPARVKALDEVRPYRAAARRRARAARRAHGIAPGHAGRSFGAAGHVYEHSHGGSGSSLSLGLFVGGGSWGLGFGYSDHDYYGHNHSSVSLSFGYGAGPWYSQSHLHHANYAGCWNWYHYGTSRFHLGYSTTAWSIYSGVHAPVTYPWFYRNCRYNFGYATYYPYTRWSPYPFYRRWCYEPYYLTYWSRAYPTYRTYYHTTYTTPTTYVVDTADPYVDQEIVFSDAEVDVWLDESPSYGSTVLVEDSLPSGIPSEFMTPFAAELPDGLDYDQLLAWGEESLFNADYLGASEAFRRAMVMRPSEDYPKFQLGAALFGAGRYRLSSLALRMGLEDNGAWLYRRFDMTAGFAGPAEFGIRVKDLERHMIQQPDDHDARFVLAYVYFFSNNLFGARSLLGVLQESGFEPVHVDKMATEAEKRLIKDR